MRGTYLDSAKFCYNLFTAKESKSNCNSGDWEREMRARLQPGAGKQDHKRGTKWW